MRNEQDFAVYVREKYQARQRQEQRMRARLIRSGATLCACVILFVGVTVFLAGQGKQGIYDGTANGGGPELDGSYGSPADATAPSAANTTADSTATTTAAPSTPSNNTPQTDEPFGGGTTDGQPPAQEAPNLDIAFENHFSEYAIPDSIIVFQSGEGTWVFSSEESGGIDAIIRICDWVLTESFTAYVPNTPEPFAPTDEPEPPSNGEPSNGDPSNSDPGTSSITDPTYYFWIVYGETQIRCTFTEEGIFQMNDGSQWQVSPDAARTLIERLSK